VHLQQTVPNLNPNRNVPRITCRCDTLFYSGWQPGALLCMIKGGGVKDQVSVRLYQLFYTTLERRASLLFDM
jgi:hypothetical protein